MDVDKELSTLSSVPHAGAGAFYSVRVLWFGLGPRKTQPCVA